MSTTSASSMPSAGAAEANPRRWTALVFIGLAQLMIILDITIVNIALPSAQRDLDISSADRQWVITAYTLAFGSLLLLGGRIADYAGRRRTFLVGLLGFAGASALGGAAAGFGMLLAARAMQGVFAALLAPAALSLLTVSFTAPRERAKAFGVFGAIAGGGGAVGLVAGGLLTEYLDWRWCLYVNVPIALVAALGWSTLPADERSGSHLRRRADVPGALLAVTGLVAIVYGCSEAESEGWGSRLVVGLLTVGAVLLVSFVLYEARSPRPLLPLRIVADRARGSAYLAVGLSVVAMFGLFLFLTYYMQVVKGYSAVLTGVAFLPLTAGVLVSAGGIATRLLPRVAPRLLMVPGLLTAATGTGWLAFLEAETSYVAGVLPAEILVGLGIGLVMAPSMNYATHGVRPDDSGIASATVNTSQQIGGSIGTALLNTIATSTTSDYVADRPKTPSVMRDGLAEGFSAAYAVAAGILVAAAVVVGLLMNTPRPQREAEAEAAQDEPVAVHLG